MKIIPAFIGDANAKNLCYGIKVFHQGRWILAGDHNGLFKFKTAEERDAKIAELEGKEIPTGEPK